MNHLKVTDMKKNLILFLFFLALVMPAVAQRTLSMGWNLWKTFAMTSTNNSSTCGTTAR